MKRYFCALALSVAMAGCAIPQVHANHQASDQEICTDDQTNMWMLNHLRSQMLMGKHGRIVQFAGIEAIPPHDPNGISCRGRVVYTDGLMQEGVMSLRRAPDGLADDAIISWTPRR